MTSMVRKSKEALKNIAKRCGFEVRRYPSQRLGESVIGDVRILSARKNLPVINVFDVGANRGDFSADALRTFHNASVYAFEPHPSTFRDLIANTRNERFKAFELALSDSTGQVSFYDYGGPGHINSLVDNARFAVRFKQTAKQILVQSETLDQVCEKLAIDAISVLKIDTEGNDLRVLKGAERLLRDGKINFVYFEFNDFALKEGVSGGSLSEIAQYLYSFGFKFVATYTDYIVTKGDFFAVANCLMMK